MRVLPAALPYACVILGLYAFHSAWGTVLAYDASILVLISRSGRMDAWRAARAGWSARPGLLLSALCVTAGPVLAALWPWMRSEGRTLSESMAALGLSGSSLAAFAIYYATVHPALEEVLWRGMLSSTRPGLSWTDGAFAGYHLLVLPLFVWWPWAVVSCAVLTGAAWLWRRLASTYGGLAIPIMTHAVADAAIILAALHLAAR